MRVNVYAEELPDQPGQIQIISKEIDGHTFTGLRFYLHLPVTRNGEQIRGPFMHRPGDDDSSAVTFWGKRELRELLRKALAMLDEHYEKRDTVEYEGVRYRVIGRSGPTVPVPSPLPMVRGRFSEQVFRYNPDDGGDRQAWSLCHLDIVEPISAAQPTITMTRFYCEAQGPNVAAADDHLLLSKWEPGGFPGGFRAVGPADKHGGVRIRPVDADRLDAAGPDAVVHCWCCSAPIRRAPVT